MTTKYPAINVESCSVCYELTSSRFRCGHHVCFSCSRNIAVNMDKAVLSEHGVACPVCRNVIKNRHLGGNNTITTYGDTTPISYMDYDSLDSEYAVRDEDDYEYSYDEKRKRRLNGALKTCSKCKARVYEKNMLGHLRKCKK